MKDAFGSLAFTISWNGATVATLWGALHYGASLPVAMALGVTAGVLMLYGLNAFGKTHHSHGKRT